DVVGIIVVVYSVRFYLDDVRVRYDFDIIFIEPSFDVGTEAAGYIGRIRSPRSNSLILRSPRDSRSSLAISMPLKPAPTMPTVAFGLSCPICSYVARDFLSVWMLNV